MKPGDSVVVARYDGTFLGKYIQPLPDNWHEVEINSDRFPVRMEQMRKARYRSSAGNIHFLCHVDCGDGEIETLWAIGRSRESMTVVEDHPVWAGAELSADDCVRVEVLKLDVDPEATLVFKPKEPLKWVADRDKAAGGFHDCTTTTADPHLQSSTTGGPCGDALATSPTTSPPSEATSMDYSELPLFGGAE